MSNKKTSDLVLYGIAIIVYIVLSVFFVMHKNNYHVDEMFSYGLSNCIGHNRLSGTVTDGETYEDVYDVYMGYLSADPDDRFNYANVWERQSHDTHPPLYYVILHTICSFFPGTFSRWYAGAINIVFGILIIFVLDKLLQNMYRLHDYWMRAAIIIGFVGAETHIVTFLRMYMMVMFIISLVSYMFICHIEKPYDRKSYIALYLVSVCGALTHYYFIIYVGLICTAFGVVLIIQKRWKEMVWFCITMVLAGISSLLAFHAMVRHLLGGTRGAQSIDNLKNASIADYGKQLINYFNVVNGEVYGGMILWIVVALCIITIVNVCIRKKQYVKVGNMTMQKFMILLFPSVVFFMFVAKSAELQSARYISPIFVVIYVLLWGMVLYVINNMKIKGCIVSVIAVCVLAGSLKAPNSYLYDTSVDFLNTIENEYAGLDSVMVYTKGFKIQAEFVEASNYGSITFIRSKRIEKLESLNNIRDKKEFMLMVMKDKDVERVQELWPEFTIADKIGECRYTKTYHMVRED